MKSHFRYLFGFVFLFILVSAVCGELEKANIIADGGGGIVRCREGVTVVLSGQQGYTIEPDAGFVKVPAGEYYLSRWIVKQTDSDGIEWYLRGEYTGRAGSIKVADGQEVQLSVDNSVEVILEAEQRQEDYRFNVELKGKAGENIEVHCGGKRISPVLHVFNENGTYDERFTFSYG